MQTIGFDLVLKALDVSLDRRKVSFTIGGLFVMTLVAGLFFYIAAEVESGFLTVLFTLLAAVAAWVLSTLVCGAVAKMSYDDLSERPAQGWQTALSYARSHLVSLLFSPLLLWIGIALVFLGEFILLFLGRIPYLGELWAALLFLPLVVLNLFLILLSYLGAWLIPAVVAGEGGGVTDTLRRVQEVVQRAPARILAYLSIAMILGLLAAMVIVPLVYWATGSTAALSALALGMEKIGKLSSAVPDMLSSLLSPGDLGGFGRLTYRARGVPFTFRIAGLIYTLAILLIPISILSTLFVVFPVSCACATYINVRGEALTRPAVGPAPSVQPGKTFCVKCGAELPPGTRFCVRCGAAQDVG